MEQPLQKWFVETCLRFNPANALAQELWHEITLFYTAKNRHYHTLTHLNNLLEELLSCKHSLENWDATIFAVVYHDSIYRAISSKNEAYSAKMAEKKLMLLNCPESIRKQCVDTILATKLHENHSSNDINLFTDADLAILGKPPEIYATYCQQVRKEYAIFPDFLYNPGRKKALQHFLNANSIYKTSHFQEKYEKQARLNMLDEINKLS